MPAANLKALFQLFESGKIRPHVTELAGLDRYAEAIDALKRRGHDIDLRDDWSIGYVTAATREDGVLRAAASPRHMQCYAAGR